MTEEPVSYRVAGGVASITLNRPAVLNALNTDLAAALAEHAEAAAADRDVTVVVVRGAAGGSPVDVRDGGVVPGAAVETAVASSAGQP